MQCFSCGKETSNLDKVCDTCKSTPSRPHEFVEKASSSTPTRFDYKSHTLLRAIIIIVSAYIGWHWAGSWFMSTSIAVANNTIGISSSENNYVNLKMVKAIRVSGRVIDINHQNISIKNAGIGAFLAYLSEADYQEFERDYIKAGKCPAGYLNSHSKTLALIPDSNANAEELKLLSLKRGDKLLLQGENLEFTSGKLKGLEFNFNAGKVSLIHVAHAWVNEESVF